MLMRLQELCDSCASRVGFLFVYFYFIWAQSDKIFPQFLCKCFVLFYFIAKKQMSEPLTTRPERWAVSAVPPEGKGKGKDKGEPFYGQK